MYYCLLSSHTYPDHNLDDMACIPLNCDDRKKAALLSVGSTRPTVCVGGLARPRNGNDLNY